MVRTEAEAEAEGAGGVGGEKPQGATQMMHSDALWIAIKEICWMTIGLPEMRV